MRAAGRLVSISVLNWTLGFAVLQAVGSTIAINVWTTGVLASLGVPGAIGLLVIAHNLL
jgi:hypothetical protein